jgi:hypothetical protein
MAGPLSPEGQPSTTLPYQPPSRRPPVERFLLAFLITFCVWFSIVFVGGMWLTNRSPRRRRRY